MTKKRLIVTAVVAIPFVYFLVLPMFWSLMPPSVAAGIASEWPHNRDMPIPISVWAWHKNFVVTNVRFYVDHQNTTAHGPNGPFYPESVFAVRGQTRWTRWGINRFTWPRRRRMEVVVPFARLAGEGVVQPGVVKGQLDIGIAYVGTMSRYEGPIITPRQFRESIPFELTLE